MATARGWNGWTLLACALCSNAPTDATYLCPACLAQRASGEARPRDRWYACPDCGQRVRATWGPCGRRAA